MTNLRQCEFMLLRYLPDVAAGEALNLGVALVEEGWPERGFAGVKIAPDRDLERIYSLDPLADVELLRGLVEELQRDFEVGTGTREGEVVKGELLRKFREEASGNFIIRECAGVSAESPVEELERLAEIYLAHRAIGRERAQSGRAEIRERMRSEFRAWNVLKAPGFVEGVMVSSYAETRNPMKIDFGYGTRDGAQFKMYHAVALGQDANLATRLAMTFPKLRRGMEERTRREARLTAIVGENVDRGRDEVSFAIETLEEAGVRVETVAAMARIAQMAAEELGV